MGVPRKMPVPLGIAKNCSFAIIPRPHIIHYMGTHIFDPDIRLVLDSIRRIVHALRLFDRDVEKHLGLSAAQVFVLQNLDENRPISINELADRTHTHQSSVSVVVEKLAQKQLVRRSRSEKDARRMEISLTASGQKIIASAPPAAQERLIAALAAFPKSRRKKLGQLLGELIYHTGIEQQPPALFFEDRHPAKRKTSRKGISKNV
jgi:DNA-binding MarR family transcriptional regulator